MPGFWLNASSWAAVEPALTAAGHTVRALTLPGLESPAADRDGIGVPDHVAAIVAAIDAAGRDEPVVLVAHSGGGPIAYAATDARPDRVARVVLVDAGPLPSGAAVNDALPEVDGQVPLPDWSFFDDADLIDLTDDLRAAMRSAAVPEPAAVTRDPVELSDPRRREVPVTVIATSMSTAQIRELIDAGHPAMGELAALRHCRLVDVPTGHWPQFTRPAELAAAILAEL